MTSSDLPARARVVVIGGGIVGASVAYHLTALGWTDLVLLEQAQLSSGTTWHAAGLVGQLRATESGTRLVQYSAGLYERLEAETGLASGFKRCGGVTVARTRDRMIQLQRTAATAAAYDLECELISPARAGELYPILATADLLGALWLPGDGTANPTDVTSSLARGARMRGARVCERTRVVGISRRGGAVAGVQTDRGDIEAEIVVNCAGQWANAVGALAGVTVPLHSAEHFYVVTDQIEGVHRNLPILRDPDGYTYFKEEVGGLVVGGFEPEAKAVGGAGSDPVPVCVSVAGRGLGALLGSHGERAGAYPGPATHRDQEVLQRSGELHPRQPVHPRAGSGAAELLRRRRVQLGGHRLGRWCGTSPGRMDRRRRADVVT